MPTKKAGTSTAKKGASGPAKTSAKAPAKPKGSAKKEAPAIAEVEPVVEDFPFPVVGVCASAGGLEAFQTFLKAMPSKTGAAFVLVQHMDPHHRSMLPDILEKSTSMPLLEAQDDLKLKPDHVYIGVANAIVDFKRGKFKLTKPTDAQHRYRALDIFLNGLARAAGSRAIGVVLSGTGSDGTQGLQAIKEHGGITFGQDPDSAKYSAMPLNAYRAGNVDFQGKPEVIAKEILRIARNPLVFPTSEREIPLDDEAAINQVFGLLRNSTRVDFSGYKRSTVQRRINHRMVLRNSGTLQKYLEFLRAHPDEVAALYNDLLIRVTEFFRDTEAFIELRKALKKVLTDRESDAAMRVWVPGCATGEEAFSIAILLLELREELGANFPVQVFGTDLSEQAVAKAREGRYDDTISAEIDPSRLERFFTKEDGQFRVNKAVREVCIFSVHNVVQDPPFSRIDLVSCRNLLIYLRGPSQERVLSALHYSLVPQGLLMLGNSESTGGLSDYFEALDAKQRIYFRRPGTRPVHFSLASGRFPTDVGETVDFGRPAPLPEPTLRLEADRYILRRHGPPSVVINENLDILQFRGDTSRYITPAPGDASLNLIRMARSGLEIELRSVFQQAKKTGNMARKQNIRFLAEDEWRNLDIEIAPLVQEDASPQRYLVIFLEKEVPLPELPSAEGDDSKFVPKDVADQEIKRLREELRDTREHLQAALEETETANEELRTANEEPLSSNEELQSTNEELQTAMEELQSTNEELTTVNEEMQNRNRELDTLNSDLENLLESANLPIIFIGHDLRIRRFTPQAEKLLHLIAGDLGRPIGDLQPRINIDDLQGIIRGVVEKEEPHRSEVLGEDGKWYELIVSPYKTRNRRIDGAVVLMVDIDVMHRRLMENNILLESGERITAASNLASMAGDILEIIGTNVGLIAGEVWHQNEEGTLARESEWQSEDAKASDLLDAGKSLKFGVGDGLPGQAWITTKPFQWTNIQDRKSGFVRHKEAKACHVSTAIALPIIADGNPTRVLTFFLDRTATQREMDALGLLAKQLGLAFSRKIAAAENAAQAQQLATMNQEMKMFTRVVAHDLGSPIRSARLHLDFVDATKLKPDQEQKLNQARNILDLVRELLDHLLEFSRIEARGQVRKQTSLAKMAKDLDSGLAALLQSTKGKIVVEEDLQFYGNETIMYHVLSNLVTNGLVHGPDKGTPVVKISGAVEDGEIHIRVADNGPGIPKEMMNAILTTDKEGHLDEGRLGLALSRHLVRRLSGELTFEPGQEEGSVAHVNLPQSE